MSWFARHHDEVKAALLKQILQPFHCERALTGVEADRFFGRVGSEFIIQLALLRECPVLVAIMI
jgi:hypothetical protein